MDPPKIIWIRFGDLPENITNVPTTCTHAIDLIRIAKTELPQEYAHVPVTEMKLYTTKNGIFVNPQRLVKELASEFGELYLEVPPVADSASMVSTRPTVTSPFSAAQTYDVEPFRCQPLGSDWTNEGVPRQRAIDRETTVESFMTALEIPYKDASVGDWSKCLFLMVRSPVCSGKTGLGQLLTQRLLKESPRLLIANMSANLNYERDKFPVQFLHKFRMPLEVFIEKIEHPRVLIIDEAQILYDVLKTGSEYFWKANVKRTLEGAYKGLRIVVLVAFGSFDPLRRNPRASTPILAPGYAICGLKPHRLNAQKTNPGLLLSWEEFHKLVACYNFICSGIIDVIWDRTEGHLGATANLLQYLEQKTSNAPPSEIDAKVRDHLFSPDAYVYLATYCRGIPKVRNVLKLAESEEPDPEKRARLVQRMLNLLERVCKGDCISRANVELSPGSQAVTELLLSSGFLYDNGNMFSFASPVHESIYLDSTRSDPLENIGSSITFSQLLGFAIQRMSGINLRKAALSNNMGAVGPTPAFIREKQFHFEIYRALTTLLPRTIFISPEHLVFSQNSNGTNRRGYVDLRIDIADGWFLELLVDGVESKEHAARFEPGGKYATALNGRSQWALIDFRRKKERAQWSNYYVHFTDDYSSATLRDVAADQITTFTLVN